MIKIIVLAFYTFLIPAICVYGKTVLGHLRLAPRIQHSRKRSINKSKQHNQYKTRSSQTSLARMLIDVITGIAPPPSWPLSTAYKTHTHTPFWEDGFASGHGNIFVQQNRQEVPEFDHINIIIVYCRTLL